MPAQRNVAELSYQQQGQLLARLLPLAENWWETIEAMRGGGWNVFLPRLNFEMSFASTEEDLLQYRRYVIEDAKCRIANPNSRIFIPRQGLPFDSEWFRQLRVLRDQELGEPYDPQKHAFWQGAVITCIRRMDLLRHEDRKEFERRMATVVQEEHRLRSGEIERHGSELPQQVTFDPEGISSFYRTVLEGHVSSLGFGVDTLRSRDGYPVFSRRINESWDLCLTPEPLVWWLGKKSGESSLLLSLQAVGQHRPLKKARLSQVLLIEIWHLIPYFDFLYRYFSTLEELEITISARICLLSMVLDELYCCFSTALGADPEKSLSPMKRL
jgi:hypothetical protein